MRVPALTDNGNVQAIRQAHSYILHRVHGNIHAAVQQGLLEFFQEQTLTTFLGQGNIQRLITLGGDPYPFDIDAGMGMPLRITHVPSLPQGKLATAGSNLERGHLLVINRSLPRNPT